MQMKKILGILLAVCFLMSVTVAAVSAEPSSVKDKQFPSKNANEHKFPAQKD
jgi:hypothetical protein